MATETVPVGFVVSDLARQVTALREENARLREALEFYASESSWSVGWQGDEPCVVLDGGERARLALWRRS